MFVFSDISIHNFFHYKTFNLDNTFFHIHKSSVDISTIFFLVIYINNPSHIRNYRFPDQSMSQMYIPYIFNLDLFDRWGQEIWLTSNFLLG